MKIILNFLFGSVYDIANTGISFDYLEILTDFCWCLRFVIYEYKIRRVSDTNIDTN